MMDLITSNGGTWGNVNKKCNYLIGASWVASRQNFKSAINYNIPIVTEGWAYESIKTGVIADPAPFLLQNPADKSSKKRVASESSENKTNNTNNNNTNKNTKSKKTNEISTPNSVSPSFSSKALEDGLKSAQQAASLPAKSCKGAPTFPSIYLAELFDEGAKDIRIRRNATIMLPLATFVTQLLNERNIVIPPIKKVAFNNIGVGKVKCPIAPVTDEDAEDLISKAVKDELIAGIKEMVAAFQEV